MASSSSKRQDRRTTVPVQLAAETEQQVQAAAEALGLSREETLLAGLRRGLDLLKPGRRRGLSR